MRPIKVLALVLLLATPGARAASPWDLPPEGSCQPAGGLHGWPVGEDAPPLPFRPGDRIETEEAGVLRSYLPPELWDHREKFFDEGMEMEIGPCFRDYGAPAFYRDATERFRSRAHLGANGSLESYTAGLPFHPDDIEATDPAAQRLRRFSLIALWDKNIAGTSRSG